MTNERRAAAGVAVLSILLWAAVAFGAEAQVVVTPNQVTVVWVHAGLLSSGDPLPAGDSLAFDVVRSRCCPVPTPQEYSVHELLERVTAPTSTVTFTTEDDYSVGVRAVRIEAGGAEHYSSIIWLDADGVPPAVVRLRFPPAAPTTLSVAVGP